MSATNAKQFNHHEHQELLKLIAHHFDCKNTNNTTNNINNNNKADNAHLHLSHQVDPQASPHFQAPNQQLGLQTSLQNQLASQFVGYMNQTTSPFYAQANRNLQSRSRPLTGQVEQQQQQACLNMLASQDLQLINALGFLSLPAHQLASSSGHSNQTNAAQAQQDQTSPLGLSFQQQYFLQAATAAAAAAAATSAARHQHQSQLNQFGPLDACRLNQAASVARLQQQQQQQQQAQAASHQQQQAPSVQRVRQTGGKNGAQRLRRCQQEDSKQSNEMLKFSISTILGHQQQQPNGATSEDGFHSPPKSDSPRRQLRLDESVDSAEEVGELCRVGRGGQQREGPKCGRVEETEANEEEIDLSCSPSAESVILSPRPVSNQSDLMATNELTQSQSAILNSTPPPPPQLATDNSGSHLNNYLNQAMARSLAAAAAAAAAASTVTNGTPPNAQMSSQQSWIKSNQMAPTTTATGGRSTINHGDRLANIDHPAQQFQTTPSNGLGGQSGASAAAAAVAAAAAAFPWTVAARGKPRRGMMRRAVFSDSQRIGLEKRFQLQKYISKPDRKKLAEKLGLRDSQVKIWFQNRRMKWRNSKERELLSAGGSREQTLPTRNNPNPDLSDVGETIKRLQQQQQQRQQQQQQVCPDSESGGGSSESSCNASGNRRMSNGAPIGNIIINNK